MRILSEAPYYDDYDPKKDYVQIAARPGFVAQSREFTQLGTISRDFLGRLGDAVLPNGILLDGAKVVVSSDKKEVKISKGRIYLDGLVRLISEDVSIPISGIGAEIIGAKIVTSVITETTDETLRDPAQSFENYNREGAHRLKESVVWTVNDNTSVQVQKLSDGQILKDTSGDNTQWLEEILAKRSYDVNGNYRVYGLQLQPRNEVFTDKILINLTEGKAYVQGYEVYKPSASTLKLNYSISTKSILGETKIYQPSGTYQLTNNSISEALRLDATVLHTQNVYRGNIRGGYDYLEKDTVEDIVSIKLVGSGTTYEYGVDFQLSNNSVDWSLIGDEPEIGAEYQVVYKYRAHLVEGIDYEIVDTEDGDGKELKFLPGGLVPVTSTKFSFDYEIYLARADAICLNSAGEVVVVEGVPAIQRLVEAPLIDTESLLLLGTVLIYPNSSEIEIYNKKDFRLTQMDLYNLLRRVQDAEYNQAVVELDRSAEEFEPATSLKGVLSEGFIDFKKCDFNNQHFDGSIDIINRYMTAPVTQTIQPLTVLPHPNFSDANFMSEFISPPITRTPVNDPNYRESQMKATSAMNVNPYGVYTPLSILEINPKADVWVDTNEVVINDTKVVNNVINKEGDVIYNITRNGRTTTPTDALIKRARDAYLKARGPSMASSSKSTGITSITSQSTTETNVDSITSESSRILSEDIVTYMRPITINVSGHNFSGGEEVRCFFNQSEVKLTAKSGYTTSSNGLVVVAPTGIVEGSFVVPKNIPNGSVEVELVGTSSNAKTRFTAEGTIRNIERILLTTNYVTDTITTSAVVNYNIRVDPLAQTFSFVENRLLDSVSLYFKKKGSESILVQVRSVVNGYPGPEILSQVVVRSSEVSTSDDASTATNIRLNSPLYCKANTSYALCILTDSSEYELYIAKLGEREIGTGKYVASQPYTGGVLFSSSDAAAWTTHQDSDLKFQLSSLSFTGGITHTFSAIETNGAHRFILRPTVFNPNNVPISWYAKFTTDTAEVPTQIFPNESVRIPVGGNNILITAVMEDNKALPAMIDKTSLSISLYKDSPTTSYISRAIFLNEPYTKVKVVADMLIPVGCDYELMYSQDDPNNWTKVTETPEKQLLASDGGIMIYRYIWDIVVPSSTIYRVRFNFTNTNKDINPEMYRILNIVKY